MSVGPMAGGSVLSHSTLCLLVGCSDAGDALGPGLPTLSQRRYLARSAAVAVGFGPGV